ncbi:MAG: CcoQ/FixQ family Cbb3-type cytochrome c oxidase assembly chaperone [Gemmatimonadales bacterium]
MSLTDLMSNAGLSSYAEVALILFLASFVGIAWWVFRPSARLRWQEAARLPLEDAPVAPSRPSAGASHE